MYLRYIVSGKKGQARQAELGSNVEVEGSLVEKGRIMCPKCGGKNVHQEATEFFAATSKKS